MPGPRAGLGPGRRVPAADGRPAIGASSAAGATPQATAEPTPRAAVDSDPAAAADVMTAMLAATVPGVNFGDPLGSTDPLSAGDLAPADVPAFPQDLDTPAANGSEPAN